MKKVVEPKRDKDRVFDFELIRRFGKLLEVIAPDAVDMGYEWMSKKNEFDGLDRHRDPSNDEKRFCERLLFRTAFTKDGVVPYAENPTMEDFKWKFAILYDNAYGRLIQKRETDFDTNNAFAENVFIGWSVKFVETEEEIDKFMTENEKYMYNYSVFGEYDLLCSQSYPIEEYIKKHNYEEPKE